MCDERFDGLRKNLKGDLDDFKSTMEFDADQLLEAAPSDACIFTDMQSRPGGRYYGYIEINSQEGHFRAEGTSSDVRRLEEELTGQVWKQIRKWKRGRFGNSSDGTGFHGESGWFGAA